MPDAATSDWLSGTGLGDETAMQPVEEKPRPAPAEPYRTPDLIKHFDAQADEAQRELLGIAREKQTADERSSAWLADRLDRRSAQMERAVGAEAQAAHNIPPPWNADEERRARETGPLEAFGSIGSIFGILASAFTKTPITSALNASAAAMTAIHNNDERAYKSAYEAWKENTALAIKRFDMERAVFEDTNRLLETDLNAWKVKTLADARRFDDRKTVAMLEANMDGEVLEVQARRIDARAKLLKVTEDIEDFDLKRQTYAEIAPQLKTLADRMGWMEAVRSGDQKAMEFYRQVATAQSQHPETPINNAERNRIRDQIESAGRLRTFNPNAQQYELIRQKYEGDPDAEQKIAAEYDAFIRKQKVAPGATTLPGEKRALIDKAKAEAEEKKGAPLTSTEEKKIVDDMTRSPPTGNAILKQQEKVDAYSESLRTIDTSIKKLESMVGAAGLAGRGTRLAERVSNVFGSNATDREQLMRDIQYLRSAGNKLLFDRDGRPISAEAERINDIIGLLSLGDTTANTLRSLRELRERYERLKANVLGRIEGTWTSETDAAPAKAAPTGKMPWDDLPVKIPAPTLH